MSLKPFSHNRICKLLSIDYPIIQAGMVWVSGGKLAAAVANCGGLGLIGAGSMSPSLLQKQIQKAKKLLSPSAKGNLGVNIPLLFREVEAQIEVALKEGIKVFFTSAGSPRSFTPLLKKEKAKVIHVTSSPTLAQKCAHAGVDAIVGEGFEAGGHNGREEITTMALIPQIRDAVDLPLIAAGGIFDGRQIAAAFALGAEGVQIGTGFVTTHESSAHLNFKEAIVKAQFGDTKLSLKKHIPVRLLKNSFAQKIHELESRGASREELETHLGKGRAKKGMHEGDLEEGELEIGQVSAMTKKMISVEEYMTNLVEQYKKACQQLPSLS